MQPVDPDPIDPAESADELANSPDVELVEDDIDPLDAERVVSGLVDHTETVLGPDDFQRIGLQPSETRLPIIRRAALRTARSLAARQLTSPSRATEEQLHRVILSTYRVLDPRQRQRPRERAHVGRVVPAALLFAGKMVVRSDWQLNSHCLTRTAVLRGSTEQGSTEQGSTEEAVTKQGVTKQNNTKQQDPFANQVAKQASNENTEKSEIASPTLEGRLDPEILQVLPEATSAGLAVWQEGVQQLVQREESTQSTAHTDDLSQPRITILNRPVTIIVLTISLFIAALALWVWGQMRRSHFSSNGGQIQCSCLRDSVSETDDSWGITDFQLGQAV